MIHNTQECGYNPWSVQSTPQLGGITRRESMIPLLVSTFKVQSRGNLSLSNRLRKIKQCLLVNIYRWRWRSWCRGCRLKKKRDRKNKIQIEGRLLGRKRRMRVVMRKKKRENRKKKRNNRKRKKILKLNKLNKRIINRIKLMN